MIKINQHIQAYYDAHKFVDHRIPWIAIKVPEDFEVTLDGEFYVLNRELTINHKQWDWNSMLHVCRTDKRPTPAVSVVKFGRLEDLYKKGYILRPTEHIIGMDGHPIMLIKGDK